MPTTRPTALVLKHLAFEDLGTLKPILLARGFEILELDVPTATFPIPEFQTAELVLLLGGPIGVYDEADYPFLTHEIAALKARLAADKPTLGICLGAQLIARALDAQVYPGQNGAEIGWFPLTAPNSIPAPNATLDESAPATSEIPAYFVPFLAPGLNLFHWHGDTFDLPTGATCLAGSAKYPHQAFSYGSNTLALQFHVEVEVANLELWFFGHAVEIGKHRISVQQLRAETSRSAPTLQAAAQQFFSAWLDSLDF